MVAKNTDKSVLRLIPKVDDLLNDPNLEEITAGVPRWIYLDAVRAELESIRHQILKGINSTSREELLDRNEIIPRIQRRIALIRQYRLRRVINGTGIIIHTNLGRSILAEEATARLLETARCYSNLEFDLEHGRRGSRHDHLKELLCRLTGAEDALVVNNNAAAVLLALNTLARGREVIVSRGELVEIGGSFRIPEVMARSGAIMKEVGTTNRTHLKDYNTAIGPQTAVILKVHTSNYRVVGFTHTVNMEDLVSLGRKTSLTIMEDLGSGCLVDLSPYGLPDEPPVKRSIDAGADLVTFSGDKLLGGPQAGIIIGRKNLIGLINANPLHRALRIDKFTASSLEATLRLYLEGEAAFSKIPVLAMIAKDQSQLKVLGQKFRNIWTEKVPDHLIITLEETSSQVGGGSLPLQEIPSMAFALVSDKLSANDIESIFRTHEPPVIGRIFEDRYLLDLRTLLEDDFPVIGSVIENLSK